MAHPIVDMTGQRVGRLIVVCRAENTKQNKAQWLCECDCGKRVIVSRRHLKDASTQSCGCLRVENGKKNTTHGLSKVNGKHTRLFRIWLGMKYRCKNHKDYADRGITVCNEWLDYKVFYIWAMKNGYAEDLTIDRIDVDGNYEPSNCRWATYKEQENNRRNNVFITIDGVTKTVSQWCEHLNMSRSQVIKQYGGNDVRK